MGKLLRLLLVGAVAVGAAARAPAQPTPGSRLAPEKNACFTCHSEADLWEGETLRLYLSAESTAEDVHFLQGVNCHDCHGGDPSTFDVPAAHATDDDEGESALTPFRFPLDEVKKSCLGCHDAVVTGLAGGAHAAPGPESDEGLPRPSSCDACHGEVKHNLLSSKDPGSGVFPHNQVRLCGRCHLEALDTYQRSRHGHALQQSGLVVTAVCADCHGAHGIYPAGDERSRLHAAAVASTCAACHRFIQERLERSVHGMAGGAGAPPGEPLSEGQAKRTPSCNDCHQGHDPSRPSSSRFRVELPSRCGDCHRDLSSRYAISMHGELTELGYAPAANCSDCHGAHEILPVSDPRSMISAGRRLETCERCHPNASPNFVDYDPHADHRDPGRDPVLHWVYVGLMSLLISTFAVFGLHSLLWFVRSLIHVIKHGRPGPLVPGETAYVRFAPFHRVAHTVMVMSFLGLALTGLPLKYSQYPWAKTLAHVLGGFQSTGIWHRFFGLVNIGCLVVYLARMFGPFAKAGTLGVKRTSVVFGPDSPVPNKRDLKDFLGMLRWFFGRGPKPTFERWTYWEKFDFWGACADIVIIGGTGLILWFPNLFCAWLPGSVLNISKVIHSTQALLATGFVFAIHFFSTHLRPEKFPMDVSVLSGLVSEKEMKEERPEYLERMRREGRLDQKRARVPSREVLVLIALGGTVALSIGVGLLAGIVLGAFQ